MNWFWLNVPLVMVFFGAWVGIPAWLVLKHPDRGPELLASARTGQAAPADPQVTLVAQRSRHLAGV